MTEEKLKASSDLFYKIKNLRMSCENTVDKDEDYYEEVVAYIAAKRKEKIEELEKEFDEM